MRFIFAFALLLLPPALIAQQTCVTHGYNPRKTTCWNKWVYDYCDARHGGNGVPWNCLRAEKARDIKALSTFVRMTTSPKVKPERVWRKCARTHGKNGVNKTKLCASQTAYKLRTRR